MEEKKGPDPARRERAYQQLNGFAEQRGMQGQQTEAAMQIAFWTELIYQHRLNLCERAKLDFEDRDLEGIITTYERLSRYCAELMYDQGWLDGVRESDV